VRRLRAVRRQCLASGLTMADARGDGKNKKRTSWGFWAGPGLQGEGMGAGRKARVSHGDGEKAGGGLLFVSGRRRCRKEESSFF
jgi:hypothetical protein